MTNNRLYVTLMVLVIGLMTACGPTATNPGTIETAATATPEAPSTNGEADAITDAATAFLAGELNVPESEIAVVSAEMVEFSDSCLGLGGPAESCLQVITPGWIIMVDVNGQSYEVHTDETGQQVRVADNSL